MELGNGNIYEANADTVLFVTLSGLLSISMVKKICICMAFIPDQIVNRICSFPSDTVLPLVNITRF